MAKWDLSKLPEGRKPLPDSWFRERAKMQERIKEFEAKLESVYEDRLRTEKQKTLGSIHIPSRIKHCMRIKKYSDSTLVMTFLCEVSLSEMMKFPKVGKKSVEDFCIEAEKVVGKKAVQLWLRGRSPDGGCGALLEHLKDSPRKSYRLEAIEYIEELEAKLAKAMAEMEKVDEYLTRLQTPNSEPLNSVNACENNIDRAKYTAEVRNEAREHWASLGNTLAELKGEM